MFEEAKFEALRAFDVFEELGAMRQVEMARKLLDRIDRNAPRTDDLVTPDELDDGGEVLETMLLVVFTNSSRSDGIIESE